MKMCDIETVVEGLEVRYSFEDALLVAIAVVDSSESKEEIEEKLGYILDFYRERVFYERFAGVKRDLGIWRKIS